EKAEAPEPAAQSRRTNRPERLSYKEQRLLQSLPERIEALEGEVAELNAALLQPGADYAALSETLAARQAELDEAFEQYCELEEKAQRLG
ncbi:MAG: ABC transporter ATP-binding protein, partial [Candidatus Spyradenecus sp.]